MKTVVPHKTFPQPSCTAESAEMSRPDMGTDIDASEYQDAPDVFDAKVEHLALMIRNSQNLVAYTGAGLSTAAGIGDYASRAKDSKVTRWDPSQGGGPHMEYLKEMRPTKGHLVLAALHHAGYLQEWINQNHDGLAQKATFPQNRLTEVHGSWFDSRNPVVAMDGQLRTDLFGKITDLAQAADTVLALGTSLSGLTSDFVAEMAAERAASFRTGLGLVIVSLTRTRLDECATLHIYATLDDTLALLASKMRLTLPTQCDVKNASKRSALFRGYAQWYRDYYDGQHLLESSVQIMTRAQPSNPALLRLCEEARQKKTRHSNQGTPRR